MPNGPQGQKRPADAIGLAVMIGKIATGEIEELSGKPHKCGAGVSGGIARSNSLSKQRRSEIAKVASAARWKKEAVR